MKQDFGVRFVAWSFVASALMMWGGWMLIPVDVGPYVKPEDFSVVDCNRYLFVWAYRVFFFGTVFSVVALVSLAALMSVSPARAVIWPGAAVAAGGAFAVALGAAFYYRHGYWGSLEMQGKSAEAVAGYIENIRMDSAYVTCLLRFGRIFGGLGLAIFALGLFKWRVVSPWLGGLGMLVGVAAIAVTMATADAFWIYAPVFHAHAIWLAAMGVVVLRNGIRLEASVVSRK